MNPNTACFKTQKTFLFAIMRGLVCLGVLVLFNLRSVAADDTLKASDGFGKASFNSAFNWNGAAAPSAGNTYSTLNFTLRTPAGISAISFAGDSLTLMPPSGGTAANGSLLLKGSDGVVVTVTNLILSGGAVGHGDNSGPTGIHWLAGNINVVSNSYFTDTSANSGRWIGVRSIISGSGYLSNICYVIYSATNTSFFGPLIAGRSPDGGGNGTIIVTNQDAMGGNPPSFNAGQLTLNGGTFRPAASFALDHANAGITIGPVGGIFDIGSGLMLTNAEPLAGPGTLSLTNVGRLVHVGTAAGFTGTLAVNNGTLVLGAGGSLAGANTLSVGSAGMFDVSAAGLSLASGQTLAGNGIVTGAVTSGSGGKISPGGSGSAATLTISSDVVMSGGSTLVCDFLATNDVLVINGNFTPSGVSTIQLANVPAVGTYPLVTVAGTLGGAANNFTVLAQTTRSRQYAVVYDTASTPKRILLQVTSAGSAGNLVWQGDAVNGVNNLWNIQTTANWLNAGIGDVYWDGDTVNFTDLGATNQPMLDVVVNPAGVNFNSSSNYVISGAGSLAGPIPLRKGGSGMLTLSLSNNAYTGGTIVTNGILLVGISLTNDVKPFGVPAGATPLVTVSNAGTFDLAGGAFDAFFTNTVQINGHGFGPTTGAIDNTVGGLSTGGGDIGIGTLVLAGNSTVSANANWQIGNTGQGIVGNGYTLTKVSSDYSLSSYLYLKRPAASALGNFIIAGGGVLFWDYANAVGTSTPITLTNGGAIDTWNPAGNVYGMTFANSIIVSDPVKGGTIFNFRTPGWTHPAYDIYNGPVTLNGTLTISNSSHSTTTPETFGRVTINGPVAGSGGLNVVGSMDYPVIVGSTIYGGNLVTLTGNNSYSGPTLVSNLVQLRITTANQNGGACSVVDYGTLDVALGFGKLTLPMTSLTLGPVNTSGGGNLGFTRLTGMPTSPVIHATNLTINAAYILPPLAGYTVGQFPLIKYNGAIGGNGFAGLQLGSLPAGVSAVLVDNAANQTIDLQVTTAGVVWKGNLSSDWDISTTANWFNPVSALAETFVDGEGVVFDDTATSFAVKVTTAVQPVGMTFNATNDYSFTTSSGGIGGSAALVKNGSGTLTIACTNNTFTGGTYINAGTLKLADQNFVYPYGGGALNNNQGGVTVASGGTLDVNGVMVPNYEQYGPAGYNVTISGAGVGGNGALLNSNSNTNNNDNACPGYVTLAGDATVGGAGDINIRHGGSPQLNSQSSAYALTKVGTGQFRLRYVTAVSTNFGAVNVLQGIVSYESSSALGFGDATKPVTIGTGAGFAWGTAVTKCMRPLICSNDATIYGRNTVSNIFTGPVTLVSGTVNLNANYYNGLVFSNVISGAGGVMVQYNTPVTFAAANTYSGATTVARCNAGSGSVLRLVGTGSISNSSSITLQGIALDQSVAGSLDVSGRSDATFTLVNGQSLRGDNGSYVRGSVIASTGTSITPGGFTNIQSMTVSNNLTLQSGSTVAMDVSLDNGVTNDLIRVVGAVTYAGTLQLANSGTNALTNGAAFKLFSAGSRSGDFASIAGSPGTGLGWTFNPTNGTATVVATMAMNPTNITVSVSGSQLTMTWPADHLGWILQSQTNTLVSGLSTNWVDVPGSGSTTQAVINVNAADPTVFFRLRSPN